MAQVTPFYCADPSQWDPDEDELHRVRDRVLPGVEVRFADVPTDATWAAVGRCLVTHTKSAFPTWAQPQVAGPFMRIWPQAKTPVAVVIAARKLLAALAKVAPITEALLLVPCVRTPELDPGPAWQGGWRVRAVDPSLPEPAACAPMDAVLGERGRAEIASRMWIAEITGEPCAVEGLDEALRVSGTAYPDGDNVERALVELIRTEKEQGTDWESHSVVGLLEDGRWAWVLTAVDKLKRGKKRGPASPRNLLLFGPSRRAFERALADGLAKHGLHASIPIDEMLRAEVDKFIGGGSLHANVFRWLANDPILHEPELQAALHARRDDQRMKRHIAGLLDGPVAPK